MTTFQDVLNKPLDEIDRPSPLPVGTYLTIVDGMPAIGELGKNKNGAAVFNLKFMQNMPDVDQSALLDALKGKPLSARSIKYTLWLTEDAAWRAKQFLRDHLQIEGGKTLSELCSMAMGRQVMVTLGHQASDDGQAIYNNVKATAKV